MAIIKKFRNGRPIDPTDPTQTIIVQPSQPSQPQVPASRPTPAATPKRGCGCGRK